MFGAKNYGFKPEIAVKMFQQVLNKLIEEKWKTSQQADAKLTQYKKFISEVKKYHHNKFASYSFIHESLDKFLTELLDKQKEYEELWVTLRILLTLSHEQAAMERGSSVNKEVLAPNLQEMSLRALRLFYSSLSAMKIKVEGVQISKELLSCNHASNRYKMFLMEKRMENEHTVRDKKRKALVEELGLAKKKKEELETFAKKMIDTADKKTKEAEKQKDAIQMKASLMESNASIEKSEKLQKRDMQTQEKAIHYLQKQLKGLD